MTARSGAKAEPLLRLYRWSRRLGLLRAVSFQRLVFVPAYFAYKRFLEDSLAPLLERYPHLVGDGHVFDVGANIGYTASVLARRVSPAARVYALEPASENYRTLCRVLRWRKHEGRVIPLEIAAGDIDGEALLSLNVDHHGDHRLTESGSASDLRRLERVRVRRLDTLAAEQGVLRTVAFVKIDVQGAELAVCRGMDEIVRANRGRLSLLVEFEAHDGRTEPLEALWRHLRELRFATQALVARDGSLRAIDRRPDPSQRGHCELLFSDRSDLGTS